MDSPTIGPLEIVLPWDVCVLAQLYQRRSAVVAEILLTVGVQRISTLPVAINFVFLISPIVSKKEKMEAFEQPIYACQGLALAAVFYLSV